MITPSMPDNEDLRTLTIDALNLINSPSEYSLDRITRLARRYFKADSCLISIVYKDMQWFKSNQGLNACSTPRDVSFCGHVVADQATLVVEDALSDRRFADNPLVLEGPKIRFYAGEPLRSKNGIILGTLCLLDSAPRVFTAEDRLDLADFARLVEREIAEPRMSVAVQNLLGTLEVHQRELLLNLKVGCWNTEGIKRVLDDEIKVARSLGYSLGVALIKIRDFEAVKERYGIARCMEFSRFAAQEIKVFASDISSLGMISDDRFLLLSPRLTSESLADMVNRILKSFECLPVKAQDITALLEIDIESELIDAKSFSQQARDELIQKVSQI